MAFITVAGENQIAAKQGAAQVLNITHFVLAYIAGLGSEPANRVEAMPDAGNIKAELPVTQSGYVNTNQVVYSLVMDSSLGDYDFNWVGLKDADGVLIACTYTPTIQKRKTTGAVPGNNLTRNFLIAFSGIQATTAIAVPAETWQIDFNARLWGIDERERLSNYDIYGHEGFFGDGWKVTRQGATTTYDVAAGVGYVGGIRIASAVTQQVTVSGPPKSIWLDVSLQGDISDVSAVVNFTIDAVLHNDYTDANGFKHYVTKIADIAADGSVTDTRVNAEFIDTPPLGDNDKSPVNSEWVQRTIGKVLTKSVAGNSNVTLTAVEAGHGILVFNGALTGNIAVIVPTSPTREWIVKNDTSGAFMLTAKTASGTGVVVAQGATTPVYTDGTHVLYSESIVPQAEAESGTATTLRGWSAQRVSQAILAQALGRLINVQVFTAPGSSTYTPTSGTKFIEVEVVGGGGAGGGAAATSTGQRSVGAGGSGGAYAKKRITSGFSGVTVTVGAGGAANSGAAGGNGGSSSFGALVSAAGGNGGATSTPSGSDVLALPSGGGSTPTSGDINAGGCTGTAGISLHTLGVMLGGYGGPSVFGGNGFGSAGLTGGTGTAPGAGGGGSSNVPSSAAKSGGGGAAGIVIVREYM
jgi:hypothetical protein